MKKWKIWFHKPRNRFRYLSHGGGLDNARERERERKQRKSSNDDQFECPKRNGKCQSGDFDFQKWWMKKQKPQCLQKINKMKKTADLIWHEMISSQQETKEKEQGRQFCMLTLILIMDEKDWKAGFDSGCRPFKNVVYISKTIIFKLRLHRYLPAQGVCSAFWRCVCGRRLDRERERGREDVYVSECRIA